jgi:hypothetical protein
MSEHKISVACRINELSEEDQLVIVRLVNHLASMPYEYQENAIARIKDISEENPYQDDIPGFKKLPITPEGEDFDINKHFDQCIKNWSRHG